MRKYYSFNTLRNQIMFGFLLVMCIILTIGGIISYRSSSTLLANNAEKHMIQTAGQANGRMEALISQINSLTLQIVTNEQVQKLLLHENDGIEATFQQRQDLSGIMNDTQIFSSDIYSLELYSSFYKRLYPLDDKSLNMRIQQEWIQMAEDSKGRLVWLGIDPGDSEYVLAIRQVSLMERWFSNGGYLIIKIHRNYFHLQDPTLQQNDGSMLLLDQNNQVITAVNNKFANLGDILDNSEPNYITIEGTRLMIVKQQSKLTGWTMVILTPLSDITEGISVLRTAAIVSGAIGFLLFFIMSWFLSTLITRPIRQLIATMKSVRLGALRVNPKSYSNMEMNELNHTYNQMVVEMNQLIQLVYEKELTQSRTELKALQAQINPHFLFNTLEAFYWSLEEKNEEELARLVIAMSHLFRYTITQSQKEERVILREELDHIERYLDIIEMRLNDRVKWEIRCEPDLEQLVIPKLLIQPLVENAVQHGIENKIGAGRVLISVVSLSKDVAQIRIEDDGVGMEQGLLAEVKQQLKSGRIRSEKGSGLAIANVYQRLCLFYPEQDQLNFQIESQPGVGTIVTFTIPKWIGGTRNAV